MLSHIYYIQKEILNLKASFISVKSHNMFMLFSCHWRRLWLSKSEQHRHNILFTG